jgi:hypothetical protein
VPTIKQYPSGTTAGVEPGRVKLPEVKRSAIKGWTAEAASRHVAFLRSIDHPAMADRCVYSFTLTLRDTPETAEEWSAVRDAWLKSVRRRGAVAYHWVVEWQRRGTPHLHGALVFDHELVPLERFELLASWVAAAQQFRPSMIGQNLGRTMDAAAWSQYVAKHSARSARHYQRAEMPPGWANSGRLWGSSREGWERRSEAYRVPLDAFHQYRRLVRSWRLSDARAEVDPVTRARRISGARTMLKNSRWEGRYRGVSEWVPGPVNSRLLAWLVDEGYDVTVMDVDAVAAARKVSEEGATA